jgi:hypothetical protein
MLCGGLCCQCLLLHECARVIAEYRRASKSMRWLLGKGCTERMLRVGKVLLVKPMHMRVPCKA